MRSVGASTGGAERSQAPGEDHLARVRLANLGARTSCQSDVHRHPGNYAGGLKRHDRVRALREQLATNDVETVIA